MVFFSITISRITVSNFRFLKNILKFSKFSLYLDGSLAEVFYGLARKNTSSGQFDKKDYFLSFVTLVIIPYVGRKLDKKMEQMKEDVLDGKIPKSDLKFRQQLIASYFNAKGIYEAAKLMQYVAFLTKFSSTGILMQRICNLQMEYSMPAQVDWTWKDVLSKKVTASKVFNDLLFRGLELSAFFLQFLQWFQNESKTTDIAALPKPKAPQIQAPIEYDGICPLCLQKWEIPTVVGVSGYVYCYKCILHYFDTRKQEDPVTKNAACIDDLRHLYED